MSSTQSGIRAASPGIARLLAGVAISTTRRQGPEKPETPPSLQK
jgi:hypothetical protein